MLDDAVGLVRFKIFALYVGYLNKSETQDIDLASEIGRWDKIIFNLTF